MGLTFEDKIRELMKSEGPGRCLVEVIRVWVGSDVSMKRGVARQLRNFADQLDMDVKRREDAS